MSKIETLLGRVFVKYKESTDSFELMRLVDIDNHDKNNKIYSVRYIDDDFNYIPYSKETEYLSEKEFMDKVSECTLLQSEGILSVSVVSIANVSGKDIDDIRLMWFTNDKDGIVDSSDPKVIASQALSDIYAASLNDSQKVGVSITKDSLPSGYTMNNFLIFDKIKESRLYHIYKLDNVDTISKLIGTKYVNNTLYDLYNGHIEYCKTNRPFFNISNFKIGDILDGYCPNIDKFISYTGFDYDLDQTIGIGHLPFKIEPDQKYLTDEQVTDFILIYGGIRVDKTYVLKFDYSIDLSTIKMKYCLCKDSDNALYIIGYTESKEDISVSQLESSIKKYYDIAKQNDDKIKARLKKLVEAYDSYKEDVKNQHEKIL